MKGKLLKKVISGVAALAMIAQLGFVIPASAAGEYYTQNYESETAGLTADTDAAGKLKTTMTLSDSTTWNSEFEAQGMSIASDKTDGIGKYYKYEQSVKKGPRTSYFSFPNAAKTLDENKKSVIEFDFKMASNEGGSQIVIGGSGVTPIGNELYRAKDAYIFSIHETDTSTFVLNSLDGKDDTYKLANGFKGGAWAHLKAVSNFNDHTVVITITSLDGKTTYFEENMLGMGSQSASGLGCIFIALSRYSDGCGIDNVVVRPYKDGDVSGTYAVATFNVDGKVSTRTADKTTGLIADVPDTTKTGYIFDGWHKNKDTETLISTETLLQTKLTENTEFTAVYSKNPEYIEPLASLKFSEFPTGGLPKMSDSADTYADNNIKVQLIGEIGTDLLANPDSRVTDLKIDWEFDGFRYIASKKEATTDAADSDEYCDSYAKVEYSTTDPSLVNFKLKKENFNFYGKVTAKVHYNGKDMEITKAMSIIPDKTIASGVILPKAGYGYIQDFSLLEDSMVGYQATTSADNKSATDIVTGDWAAYGGNSGRGLYVAKDEDVDGKFLKLKATGTNSSTFAVNKISEAPTGQVIIEQDVRFYNNTSILLKQDNPVTWSDNATSFSLNFTGSAMDMNGSTICSATTGQWYHLVLAADVTSKLCYAIAYDMEGNLLGQSDTVAFTDAGSVEPLYLCYRTPDSSTGEFDFNNVTMYVPEVAGDLQTTTSTDTIIIPSDEIDDGISFKSNKITVKDEEAEDDTKATAIAATYANNKLTSVKTFPLTFKDGIATADATISNNTTLMVWDSISGMTPLYDPILVEDASVGDTVNADLTVKALSTGGYEMIGNAEWTVVDASTGEASDKVTITPDKENSHNATLSVAKGAASGTYNVIVSLGGKTKTIEIVATGTQESVKFTKATSSIAIPLEDGTSDEYTYTAAVVDKNSRDLERDVTYAMYDKNNANEITTLTGISFDKTTGKLTVTSEAQATTVYIRASGTNTDDETISTSLKVTIHGLAFDLGSADGVAEGYTLVSPTTAYTEANGYGIVSGSPTIAGTVPSDDPDADNLTGAFKFQAKVEAKKVYKVTINYFGNLASEYVNSEMTGVTRSNAEKSAVTYQVPVIDDLLDLTFTGNAVVSSIVIEKQPDKQPGGKPTVFSVGDSTNANNGSWAYCLARDQANYTEFAKLVSFQNNGQGSQNLVSYYNGGQLVDRVLVNIKPGDYVTVGDMGTNGMGSYFEADFNYYLDACEAMGAKVIPNSYSPHGALTGGGYESGYNSETHTFDSYRKDEYDNVVRRIYAERSDAEGEKYDPNCVGFVDIGKMADAAFNAYIADYAKNGYASADEAAAAIIASWPKDHNHYNGLASDLMVQGYGDDPAAMGIHRKLTQIITADLAKNAD